MPNYMKNYVHCCDQRAILLLRDFNNIIPMPLSLLNVQSGTSSFLFKELYDRGIPFDDICKNHIPHYFADKEDGLECWRKLCLGYYFNLKVHGAIDWYEWTCRHWETKWNAMDYSYNDSDLSATFLTAWSHPMPVIKQLSKMFPDSEIFVKYSEEEIGCYTGHYSIQDGCLLHHVEYEDFSNDAMELAIELWQREDLYRWNDDTEQYTYIDEEQECF